MRLEMDLVSQSRRVAWLAALAMIAGAAATPARVAAARSSTPDTTRVLRTVRALADPKWEGRGVGTAGIDSAAAFIAREMASAGLAPAGEKGGWFQPFDVTTGVEVQDPCALEVGGRRFDKRDAIVPLGFSTNGIVNARVVWAGYGITAPGLDYDDYAGIDAHDALVLVMTNEPGELDSTSKFDGTINTPYAELRTKAINAREHGALGMLVVNGPKHHAGEPLRPPASDGVGYMSSGLLAAQVSEEVANALLKAGGLDLAAAQMAIEGHGAPHSLALPESASVSLNLRRTRATAKNVVGLLRGADTTRTLVVGAHYDHLGYGGSSALDPDTHAPHVGADDNASGVAALLEAARAVAARSKATRRLPQHTIVFAAFSGEEIGLVGSSQFVLDPPRPMESIEAMLNMDMVGRLRNDQLAVMGVGTAAEFPALVANVNAALGGQPMATAVNKREALGFNVKTSDDGYGPSDHSSFYKRDVPVLMLFTGAHADYHKVSDTWDKINYRGLARVASYATAVVESLDARPKPTYTKAKADASPGRIAGGGGYGAYLGTIPDYMQTEGGVLLSGVRNGGPAEKAGLKGGDVIVRFDGIRVDNIYDYTFALRSRKPGQDVRITVKRGGQEVDLVATLGRRP